MTRITYIFLVFLCVISSTGFCQKTQNTEAHKDTHLYNKEQLDSMMLRMRAYFYEGSYDMVIEQTPALIKNAQAIQEIESERPFWSVLGNAFIQLDDTDKASELFNESLIYAQEIKDTLFIVSSYINLGNTYIKEDPKRAIKYFDDALDLGMVMQDNRITFITHNNLSELYVGINMPQKAQYHVDKALPLVYLQSEDLKDEYLATVYHVQGAIYLQQEKYDEAIEYILKSIELGENNYQEETLLNNYKHLIDAYDKTGQYEALNIIRKQYDMLRDRRYENDIIKQQQIARSKFNLDQYEQKLRASQLENQLTQQKASKSRLLSIFSLTIGAILLLLMGFLLYVRHKRNKLLKDLKIKNQQYLEAKEKSEKLAQAKTKFLSTISHELRTPLYGIIGLSSVLINNPKLKDHLENLTSLKFSADYLLSLINDVLQLNKLESQSGQEVQNSYFKIENLIHSILQTFEFINQQNNNVVSVDIDPDMPEVLSGDQMKISQVLMNLISNASKFTQDGFIDISIQSTRKENQNVELLFCIKDTGIGIPEEKQGKIFDEFTQITNSSGYEGTGLGLPIVNKILTLLGSTIQLESAYGKGTTFTFPLELGVGVESDIERIEENNLCYKKLDQKKILIVDDNKINQLVTQKVLEQYGLQHHTASNGLEALNTAKDHEFDVILMDVNMPVMNGLDSSKAIRKLDIDTPIIALTAINSTDPEKDFASFGISDAIIKPYKTEKLLELLLKYIN